MKQELLYLFLLFFIFSFLGWCMEVTLMFRKYHRFINRGFLTGPWLPIYGSGAVMITVAVQAFAPIERGFIASFFFSFVICGIWEYSISYYLEKKFHARWWDYSKRPMNLNGRIWIGNLILFGLGGVLIIHFLDPLFSQLIHRIPLLPQEVLVCVLSVSLLTDFLVSHLVLKLIKQQTETSTADDTEQINREIRQLFSSRSYFYRRFTDAYPEVVYRTERISARLDKIREETERLRMEAQQRVEKGASLLRENLENRRNR